MKTIRITTLVIGTLLTSGCMVFMPGDHMGHQGSGDRSTEWRDDGGSPHSH